MLLLLAVLSGQLVATIEPHTAYPVELTYRFVLSPEATALDFTILEAKGASIDHMTVEGQPLALDRAGAPLLRGRVPVSAGTDSVTFRYLVTGTTVPVVVLGLAPEEARPDTFSASLRIPDGMHVVESFPTGLVAVADEYRLELPVVPAFVSLTVSDHPTISVPAIVDGAALAILVMVGALVFLRRGAAR